MDYYEEFEDEAEYDPTAEDWIPLGFGVWLLRYFTAHGTHVGWAIEQPGGGTRVSL